MSRSFFASFPVCVYKFSSHYLNNIIFIDNSFGSLARESPCSSHTDTPHPVGLLWSSDQFVAEAATYRTYNNEDKYVFLIIPRSVVPRIRNVSGKCCGEDQNTHFMSH